MKIAIIGSGYVGLVTGACFADTGNTVFCVDKDEAKIAALKEGRIPIFEPGLETLVARGKEEGRLIFTNSTTEAVASAEVVFLAVGTPALPSDEPDLKYLKGASEEVARAMTGYRLIVNKSTVPIGSHRVVAQWIAPHTNHNFDVASNPEFLKEGTAVDDFLRPDRVVIGTDKDEVYRMMAELYAPFVRQGNPILRMDPLSAEITKYACNSFLATRISFMNELAVLCEKVGGDVKEVRKGMITDVRIGKHFLYPGIGYGGSCFPKDVQALMNTAKLYNVPMGIIDAAEAANSRQKHHIVTRIRSEMGENLSGMTFGLWGLSFKPNTDDMREAPSLTIIDDLLAAGARVQVFDPVASGNAKKILGRRVIFCDNAYDTVNGAHALVIATEWNEFRHPDFERMKKLLLQPLIFDGRNLYAPEQMRKLGFAYFGIGRQA